ncbi:MAG: hypothetical protein P1T08_05720 [Acidimicrobiia bacterium]|nr:hypothetical protein [Acidimicrobiia bacterium]
MEPKMQIAVQQLARMRGMTAMYHRQFFADVRFTLVIGIGTVVVAVVYDRRLIAFLPIIALIGAAQTAFDASYLIFARHYARSLEGYLNRTLKEEILVAARLEDAYLFPLDRPKLVTLPLSGGLTWFGFMTALYTAFGVGFFVVGMILAYDALPAQWNDVYLGVMALVTAISFAVGWMWFWRGEGEARLRAILDDYPSSVDG